MATTDASTTELAPTKFVVRSHLERKRSYPKTVGLMALIIGGMWYLDPMIQINVLWVLAGLAVGLVLLETAPLKRDVELRLTVCPLLGVQRTTCINKRRLVHHPLLPRASIQDCILTEHVGAFSVSTNVVFRVEEASSSKLIVPAFPNASLSFAQCHSLVKKIQRALNEV
jgi:hypothetical protein